MTSLSSAPLNRRQFLKLGAGASAALATIGMTATRVTAVNQGKVIPFSRSRAEVELSGLFPVAFKNKIITCIRIQILNPGVMIVGWRDLHS